MSKWSYQHGETYFRDSGPLTCNIQGDSGGDGYILSICLGSQNKQIQLICSSPVCICSRDTMITCNLKTKHNTKPTKQKLIKLNLITSKCLKNFIRLTKCSNVKVKHCLKNFIRLSKCLINVVKMNMHISRLFMVSVMAVFYMQ